MTIDREEEGWPAPFSMVGLSYRSAPLAIRSRLSFDPPAVQEFLALALERGISEVVLLSTCNRTECYFAGCEPSDVAGLLADRAGMSIDDLQPFLFVRSGEAAARHLFRVASGIDSAVLGETEIVAQVKQAFELARNSGALGSNLDTLFRRAQSASKRVRSETELCRNVTSTGSLAIRVASHRFGTLRDRHALVLGAGKMAERIVKELRPTEVQTVRVLNRTEGRAAALAAWCGGSYGVLEDLDRALAETDVVFATLGSASPVLTADGLRRIMAAREGRPLFIVDLGVPPNVEEPAPAGVEVVHLDQLVADCEANSQRRAAALPAALALLDEELLALRDSLRERAAASTIRALVERGDAIRQRNVDWARERLADLGPKEMRVVEEMARRLMIGMLEVPLAGLKGELSTPRDREVVERLFALSGGEADR